jgi:hypothetical protein
MKRPTLAQMKRALEWGAKVLSLHGWDIRLAYSDRVPRWWDGEATIAGASQYQAARRWADVCVRPGRCEECGYDIYETLFHELVHVRIGAMGHESPDGAQLMLEWACDDFAAIMRKAYR